MVYAEEIDSSILATLCEEPAPWPQWELAREHGGRVPVADAVARLARRGLVLKLGADYVIASASGRYANALGGERP